MNLFLDKAPTVDEPLFLDETSTVDELLFEDEALSTLQPFP